MKKKKTIVVDEAVSEECSVRFISFLKKRGFKNLEPLFISKKHRSMPDSRILHHLLDGKTIFLTTDRPMHNKVLSKGLTSYYVSKKKFIAKKLKGIKIKDNYAVHKKDAAPKDDYHLPKTEIRPFLLPTSEKSLKRLRTRRRRIRNHFGGYDHLDLVAITVSWKAGPKSSTIIGLKFRVSSNIGAKALDAGESYIRERIAPGDRDIVALNYAAIQSIRLMLHFVKTHVYFDSPKMSDPSPYLEKDHQNPYATLFAELCKNFPDIEFIPSTKGVFIERLRAKLINLSRRPTNEIVPGNISEMLDNVQNRKAHKPTPMNKVQPS